MIHDIFEVDAYNEGIYREETITLMFVLSGNIIMQMQEKFITLSACDVVVFNPFEPIIIRSAAENLHTIVLRIPTEILASVQSSYSTLEIQCRLIGRDQERGYEIKNIFAQIFWNYFKDESGSDIAVQSLLYKLLYCLLKNYGIKKSLRAAVKSRPLECVQKASQYVRKNFCEKITLQSTAQYLAVTPSHLSRIFKDVMSISFSEYLTQVRLAHVIHEFNTSAEKSITEIAFCAGFTNINSFYVAFHKAFGMTPSKFRNAKRRADNQDLQIAEIKTLLQYQKEHKQGDMNQVLTDSETVIHEMIDIQTKQSIFQHTWQRIINVGYAGEIISANVQRQLRIMQENIGFTHLRFHGILDDDINIYTEDTMGNPVLYFTYLDMILDFLDSIHLKPYIEFSFIPSKLAKHLYSPFSHKAYISGVKSMEKWRFLIRGIITHCVERYGLAHVKQWYFSFIGFNWIQCGYIPAYAMSFDEYYALYFALYEEIKQINSDFRIGGPATDIFTLDTDTTVSLQDWMDTCAKHHCPPDFIAMHFYPLLAQHMVAKSPYTTNRIMISDTAFASRSADENYINAHLKHLKQILRKNNMAKTEIIIDEWNSSLWQRDPINDTCFRSAYIAKNILENASEVTAMAQAFVSDYSIETYPEKEIFYGDVGMFTNHDIRKNVFHVYRLFSKLGEIKIASGNGWAVFMNDQTLQIVLYSYCHYNRLLGYTVTELSKSDRYFVFPKKENINYQFSFQGMRKGKYVLKDWRINRENGSAYDKWVQMGSPQDLTVEEIRYLDRVSEPSYYKNRVEYDGDMFSFTIKPHEVAFIEIEPVL